MGTRPVAVWWELGPKRNHWPKVQMLDFAWQSVSKMKAALEFFTVR